MKNITIRESKSKRLERLEKQKLTLTHRNRLNAAKLLTSAESEAFAFASSSEAITVNSKNGCPGVNTRSNYNNV